MCVCVGGGGGLYSKSRPCYQKIFWSMIKKCCHSSNLLAHFFSTVLALEYSVLTYVFDQ